jgi:RNA polymerase sigma-70 factor (ECF subfamily)
MRQGGATDEQLLARVAAGDQAALEPLMQRWHDPLLSFIARSTDLDVEDIYQETWMRVVRSRTRFDTQAKFSTWLFQIALNLCRDAHRRQAARPQTTSLDAAAQLAAPHGADTALHVRGALAALPAPDRELIALRYYLGFSERETAAILDTPLGTVKSRTHTAVARFKELLDEI